MEDELGGLDDLDNLDNFTLDMGALQSETKALHKCEPLKLR